MFFSTQPIFSLALVSSGMAVSIRGLYFVVTLFLGSFFGSVFMLGPFLPIMLVSPAWYRWITDRIVAIWLTLPVVREDLLNPSGFVTCLT